MIRFLAVSIRVPKPNITAIVPTKNSPINTIARYFLGTRPMYISKKQVVNNKAEVETLVKAMQIQTMIIFIAIGTTSLNRYSKCCRFANIKARLVMSDNLAISEGIKVIPPK